MVVVPLFTGVAVNVTGVLKGIVSVFVAILTDEIRILLTVIFTS